MRRQGELTSGRLGGETTSSLDTEDTADAFIARHAVDWIKRQADQATPWFLHASFCGPHFPIDPPTDCLAQYDPDTMPPPEGVENPDDIRAWQQRRAHYCAAITHVDAMIGDVLDALERIGATSNTLVILTTDHGDRMGHHGAGDKGTPEDTSCRPPVLARLPGVIPAGRLSDGLIESVDLPCTMLDAAGMDAPSTLPGTPGQSALPLLSGESEHHRDTIYAEGTGWRMCRDRDCKYICRTDGGEELYDLGRDPWECDNRIDDAAYRTHVRRLSAELIRRMAEASPPDERPLPLPVHNWFDTHLPPGELPEG